MRGALRSIGRSRLLDYVSESDKHASPLGIIDKKFNDIFDHINLKKKYNKEALKRLSELIPIIQKLDYPSNEFHIWVSKPNPNPDEWDDHGDKGELIYRIC